MQTVTKGYRYMWIIVLSICLQILWYIFSGLRLGSFDLPCHEVRNLSHLHLHPGRFADISLISFLKILSEIECVEQAELFWQGNDEGCTAFHVRHLRECHGLGPLSSAGVSALSLPFSPLWMLFLVYLHEWAFGRVGYKSKTEYFGSLFGRVTFGKIVRRGSTEEFSGIPYVFTMLNCLLYAWYGLPFVTSHNVLLTTVNGAGAALEFIYVCIFLMYAPPKPRMKILRIFMGALAFFTTVAVVSLLAVHHNARKLLVGSIATAFSVCMYASPLSIMRLVIQTKSVQFMPFFLSLFVFLCGTSWFLYGIFGKDAFVAAPNGIGASLGIAQLVLYFIYKDSAPTKDGGANEGGKGHEVEKPFSSSNDETKVTQKLDGSA